MTNAHQIAPADNEAGDERLSLEEGGSMNRTSWLDKPFSARHCLRWLRRAMYVVVPVYLLAFFLNAWMLKFGGVSAQHSPYKDRFPSTCSGYIDRSAGTPAGRTSFDSLLLRERVRRFPLQAVLETESQLLPCLGYAVLAGMHGKIAGDANFTDVYVDSFGKPVVSISVRFEQVLREESK